VTTIITVIIAIVYNIREEYSLAFISQWFLAKSKDLAVSQLPSYKGLARTTFCMTRIPTSRLLTTRAKITSCDGLRNKNNTINTFFIYIFTLIFSEHISNIRCIEIYFNLKTKNSHCIIIYKCLIINLIYLSVHMWLQSFVKNTRNNK